MSARSASAAFTLIELLAVICIIMVLMSMLMVVYRVVMQSMRTRGTDNTLRKVDSCLRMFRSEWGVFPYQQAYPEPFDGSGFPNRLYRRLGMDMDWSGSPSDAARCKDDAAAAAGKFNDASPTALTYRTTDVPAGYTASYAGRLNTMARQRVRLALIAGNLELRGPLITTTAGIPQSDRRSTDVLTVAERTSTARPGWNCDYLRGEIEARSIRGDAILDTWGHELVYICQFVPGIKMAVSGGNDSQITYSNVRFGLGAQGFDPTAGPAASLVAAGRGQLLYQGRIRLSKTNAGDGLPTPADATWFPDPNQLMGSDMRYYSAPGFQIDFELWSAGRDGRFDYRRDHPSNRDNLSAGPYDRELR